MLTYMHNHPNIHHTRPPPYPPTQILSRYPGMSFILANFLGNYPANSDQIEDKQLIIEKLTAKMVNSGHLEDRRAAAQTIKSLARSHCLVRTEGDSIPSLSKRNISRKSVL